METPKQQRENRKRLIEDLVNDVYREVVVDVNGWYDSQKFVNSTLRRRLRNMINAAVGEINLDVLESRLTFDKLRKKVSSKDVDDFQLSTVVHRVRKEFRDANGMNE